MIDNKFIEDEYEDHDDEDELIGDDKIPERLKAIIRKREKQAETGIDGGFLLFLIISILQKTQVNRL